MLRHAEHSRNNESGSRLLLQRRLPLLATAASRVLLLLLLACAFLSAASCSVSQSLNLTLSGSASLNLDVGLSPVFATYLLDLSEAVSPDSDRSKERIFNLDEIKKSLKLKPGVKIGKLASGKQGSLSLSLAFDSLKALADSIKRESGRSILTLKETGSLKEVGFYLDKKNYKQLSEFFPLLSNPVFESLSPQENEDITESEYLDIILFALGEDGPGAVKSSGIKVKVRVEGEIVSQKGGKASGNEVTFTIPLIKVLLLKDPIDLSVSYR